MTDRTALGLAQSATLTTDERAELELLRDVAQRLIQFDGGAEVMDWATRHPLHKDDPYIGCPFCRDHFELRPESRAGRRVEGAGEGIYWCCVCGRNPVNANDGFDTCHDCVGAV